MIFRTLPLLSLIISAWVAGASAQTLKSQAESWGLNNEEPSVVSGRIVDIACQLTKDCPPQCGGGSRQLGLLTSTGRLIVVAKNAQPFFNGAVTDLLPYCGQLVDVDGLMTGNEGNRVLQLQLIRRQGVSDWSKAELWTQEWQRRNPELADKAEEWFYHDPRIKEQIDAKGYLGLGGSADREFAKTR